MWSVAKMLGVGGEGMVVVVGGVGSMVVCGDAGGEGVEVVESVGHCGGVDLGDQSGAGEVEQSDGDQLGADGGQWRGEGAELIIGACVVEAAAHGVVPAGPDDNQVGAEI